MSTKIAIGVRAALLGSGVFGALHAMPLPTQEPQVEEIMVDGSSAIYGSDAIAGVVNLIPRHNLDGVEALTLNKTW